MPEETVFTCKCGKSGIADEHTLGPAVGPHGNKVLCGECGTALGWQAKAGNAKRRTDRNASHRARWRKAQNGLVCHVCLVKDDDTRGFFEIDHILPLEFGGVDEFRNTRPLCAACHTIRHALLTYQRNLRNQSARNGAA